MRRKYGENWEEHYEEELEERKKKSANDKTKKVKR